MKAGKFLVLAHDSRTDAGYARYTLTNLDLEPSAMHVPSAV
jgi:hypothetical protein